MENADKAINYGTTAIDFDVKTQHNDLSTPTPEKDGKVKTLNGMGFMTLEHDPFSQEFIDYAHQTSAPVLEIGTAYGFTASEAIKKGSGIFVANDLDQRHLLLLKAKIPDNRKPFVYLNNKRFPNELNFPYSTFGAILLCKMMHFLTPKEMEEGIEKLHKWLKPGGKLFIVTTTPFHHYLKSFVPIYEQRWNSGDHWPGVILNMREYASDLGEKIPNFLHVMDQRPLVKALTKQGFSIEKAELFDFKRPNAKPSGGKGYCGIVAVKN